ncbi:glycoside hydrolase [Exidia glandulosa HHB12029]|uniref:glucan endo-1,3-beta-D-glucosidase n=1 Tax=Exidia glandulosa HHB12029 TaxID=1314781 RepID=A0A165Q0A2_EXIGL|nr:glycoside hydrolase [Exidia glandulosa HHB12029]
MSNNYGGYNNYSTQDLQAAPASQGYGSSLPAGARPPRAFNGQQTYAPIPLPEANAPRNAVWLEKQQARSRRSRYIIIGLIVLVIAIIVAVAVGVTVSKNSHKNVNASSDNSSDSDLSDSGTSSGAVKSDPSDPSNFEKDSNLHNAFFGIAYTPTGAILPACGANQKDVIEDIQLLSQITNRIRLYGADCNITALVLNAIKVTKVDMQVYLGNYISVSDDSAYQRQKATIIQALKDYGADNVYGITVGNEVMLNYCLDNGLDDPNSPTATPAAQYIATSVADTRTAVNALGLGKTILVGNSDAGSYFSTQVLEAIDYGLSNVHPWFAHTKAQDGAAWTYSFFQDQNVGPAAATTKKPEMYIAETGWPSGSKTPDTANDGAGTGGEASVANLQVYLDTFVCQANSNGTKYFYFEFKDEEWKNITFGGVEGYWGIFDKNKKLKQGIKLPTCSHP